MNKMVLILGLSLLCACSDTAPRRPINPKPSTTIYTETVNEAKKLRILEEQRIEKFIIQDSTNQYRVSENGFWYHYNQKIEAEKRTPKKGDTVRFTYDMKFLNDSIIYSTSDLGITTYVVDKQDMITGIQKGIKLMKEGETITFVFPSAVAFGTAGDGSKIGVYQSIKSTITLLNIK